MKKTRKFKGPYWMVPCELGRSNLKDSAKLLLGYYLSLDCTPAPHTPSIKTIERDTGIRERSFRRYREELIAKGLITFEGNKFKINYEHKLLNSNSKSIEDEKIPEKPMSPSGTPAPEISTDAPPSKLDDLEEKLKSNQKLSREFKEKFQKDADLGDEDLALIEGFLSEN